MAKLVDSSDTGNGPVVSAAGLPVSWRPRRADAGLAKADEVPGTATPHHAETAATIWWPACCAPMLTCFVIVSAVVLQTRSALSRARKSRLRAAVLLQAGPDVHITLAIAWQT